ncbi:hypothetical protein [Actinobaculum sp. 352]|uniref:hypothetical protein n=1 Tax=Actinobaculum sp. 352 TaxID=2490946 RepID=UPI000F7F11E9|nr:hypothetical protein [Actinobaculum sp. 352]RTE50814.1 hypothetical protein EKN07_01365 [Actinobaculum sp. 352]
MRRGLTLLGSLLAASLALGSAAAATPSEKTTGMRGTTTVVAQVQDQESDLDEIFRKSETVPADGVMHETNGIRWKVVSDDQTGGTASPQFHVGVGRYLCIYLTPRDWNFGSSVGWGGAAGGLCTLAGGGVIGGVACSALGSALGWYLADKTGPKGRQCAEI